MVFRGHTNKFMLLAGMATTLLYFSACSDVEKSKQQSAQEMVLFPFNSTKPVEAKTVQFTARLVYFDSSFENITEEALWKSSDTDVATIYENNGTVSIKGVGYSVISAEYMLDGALYTESSTLTVKDNLLVSIEISEENVSVPLGEAYNYKAMGTFKDGDQYTITKLVKWESTRPDVATITKELRFAKAQTNASARVGDETVITASFRNKVDASTLKIIPPILKSIEVRYSPRPLHISDGSVVFDAKGMMSDGTDRNVTRTVNWESRDENILKFETPLQPNKATIYAEGNVTVVAKEKGVIIGGIKESVEVKVLP